MPMLCIIAWEDDIAGLNIVNNVVSFVEAEKELVNMQVGNTKVKVKYSARNLDIYIVSTDTVFLEGIEELTSKYEAIAFASRHESRSKMPVLSIHVPGNLTGEAKFGGKPFSLCYANGMLMIELFKRIYDAYEQSPFPRMGWECCYEATHHGPYVDEKPAFYIEIGSSPEEWKNERAGAILAEALVSVSTMTFNNASVVGVSGLHYASNLARKCMRRDMPLGHIIPRYAVEALSEDRERLALAIRETVDKSLGFKGFVMEKKALKSAHKKVFMEVLREEYPHTPLVRI
ncbi:MAG: hypothetical protein J7L11_01920 [Thermoprotei archaeon]|nr:hypothetical protein [Thermoprotei archaeon]